MDKYCIITPTYKAHFKYINNYLNSFCKYVTDGDKVTICFVLSDLSERAKFEKLIAPYRRELRIKVLYFSEVLKEYGIAEHPDMLLRKYGKYSYQIMKKLYAMLWQDAEYFLVLDSESMWVRKTSMEKLFENFFRNPFILGSSVAQRYEDGTQTELMYKTLKGVEAVLGGECKYVFHEHFTWFYSKQIIADMCRRYGEPFDMVKKVYAYEMETYGKKFGLMDCTLMHEYIYRNLEKYHFRFIQAETAMEAFMGADRYQAYREYWLGTFWGQFGFIEFPFTQLRKDYVKPFGRFFRENGVCIIRCFNYPKDNEEYALQKKFIRSARPNILAASQEHPFGAPFSGTAQRFWKIMRNKAKRALLKCRDLWRRFRTAVSVRRQKGAFARLRRGVAAEEKTVLFSAYAGCSFSCNPKAIYEEMLGDKRYKDYNFIWAFAAPERFLFLEKNRNTSVVKYGSKEYEMACCRAKYWVSNYTMPEHIWPKEDQVYIQTWHGKPLKRIGGDIKHDVGERMEVKTMKARYRNDAMKMRYFLSASDFYAQCMASAFSIPPERAKLVLVPGGYARNKSLFTYTDGDVRAVKERLKIGPGKKVVFYAPTWRPDQNRRNDFAAVTSCLAHLKEELGDGAVILYRAHNMTHMADIPDGVLCVNDGDINDIYIVSDLLISDYSGAIQDYANLKRPMVFYCYDRRRYEANPGLYLDLDELPGPIVYEEKDLGPAVAETLASFSYDEKYARFNQRHNPYEGADCAKRIVETCIG